MQLSPGSMRARPAPEAFYESSGAATFTPSSVMKRRKHTMDWDKTPSPESPPAFSLDLLPPPLRRHNHHHSHRITHRCPNKGNVSPSSSPSLVRRSFWNTKCSCIFSAVPDEIMLFNVFMFLGREDICTLAGVCTRWKWLSSDRALWRNLDVSAHAQKINDFQLTQLLKRHGGYMNTLKLCGATLLSSVFMSGFSSMLPKLQEVHLCKAKWVTDSTVVSLVKSCPQLTSMSLFGCPLITDAAVQAIGSHLPQLKELSVRGCKQLTSEALVTLGPMLESINVGGCSRMNAEVALIIAARCRQLRRLNLHGVNMSDAALAYLVQGCSLLQNLQASSSNPFGGNSNITDEGMGALATLKDLKSLNLQGSSGISDAGLVALAHGCTGLECLNLGGVYRITDEGVAEMTKHMTRLTMISLFQCFNLSDLSVLRMAELPNLEQLDLHSCVGLIRALDIIGAAAPRLTVLDLGSCRNIPQEDVQLFKQHRPEVKLTHY